MALVALCIAVPNAESAADTLQVPRAGTFLVAGPKLAHPLWRETVILLLAHDEGGSVGVIVNRPLRGAGLPEWFPGDAFPLAEGERHAYFGGPVARDGFVLLLRSDTPPRGGVEVVDGLYHGPARALLGARVRRAESSELRLYAGHAGWGPGQLAGELERGDWQVLPADAETAFARDGEKLWPRLRARGRQRWVDDAPRLPVALAAALSPR